MAARKRVPAEDKSTEHLTVNLTPAEMEALKQLAKDDGRSVNSLVKRILTDEIRNRTFSSNPFFVSIDMPGQAPWAYSTQRATDENEVRRIATEAIAEGARKVTVYKKVSGKMTNFDAWFPTRGWIDGRIEPKEVE